MTEPVRLGRVARNLGLGLVLMLSGGLGCASTPPPATCAAIGAMLGGGGGAVAGAKTDRGHDGDSIAGYGALGIAVGGGAGYLICKALHKEPEELEAETQVARAPEPPAPAQPRVEPTPQPSQPTPAPPPMADPCRERLDFDGVYFDFDKSTIKPTGEEVLRRVAVRLNECRDVQIRIIGHTDSVGTDSYNQGLSERRAASASRFLVGQGIQASRLTTEGRGETEPVATNDTPAGRAKNRRVELHPSR